MKKKSRKPKKLVLRDELFDRDLIVVVGSIGGALPVLDEMGLETDKIDENVGMCWRDNDLGYVIWVEKRNIRTLVHELVHFVMSALESRGIPISIENQETFAYYYDYWFDKVTEKW